MAHRKFDMLTYRTLKGGWSRCNQTGERIKSSRVKQHRIANAVLVGAERNRNARGEGLRPAALIKKPSVRRYRQSFRMFY